MSSLWLHCSIYLKYALSQFVDSDKICGLICIGIQVDIDLKGTTGNKGAKKAPSGRGGGGGSDSSARKGGRGSGTASKRKR